MNESLYGYKHLFGTFSVGRARGMNHLDCVFRSDIRDNAASETARCRLLEQVAGLSASDGIRVPRSACMACLDHSANGILAEHPILTSLLYQQCETMLDNPALAAELPVDQRDRLARLRVAAETGLRLQSERLKPIGFLPSCDVIICANWSAPTLRISIQSVLDQIDVTPVVHLIDTGTAGAVFDEYKERWNVRCYRMMPGTSTLGGLHRILESLMTSFVAIQSAVGSSEPDRLSESIRALVANGGEIFATSCFGESILSASAVMSRDYCRRVNPATLVMRRATFVDMGGIADGFPDDDVEFIHRAICEGRKIVLGDGPLVRLLDREDLPPAGRPPIYPRLRHSCLRSFARGFPQGKTACDIVLPFYGHLDYVEESLNGLLQQQNSEIVIHLVDDATPNDTAPFLKKWSRHHNVRTYRNRENIGQFQSFNNISAYFETELAAVQDADDISLPHRIEWSAQMMHHSGADFFGGAVELFSDSAERPERPQIRHSIYPEQSKDLYFVENPTAVFRVSMFRELGGFADFGNRLSNRTSLDTEFQMRCRYHGVRFAVSRDVVVRYRVHSDSATRNNLTGWGTVARNNAGRQIAERDELFRRGGFDPKSFGALGRYSQISERL